MSNSFVIPEEPDRDLAEYDIKHDPISFEVVGNTVYLTQSDINSDTPIGAGERYDAVLSLGPEQMEALYFGLGRILNKKETN